MKTAALTSEVRGPLLVLAIVVPLLAVTGWRLHDAVATTGRFEHNVRIAQTARAAVLANQLDEETGIRGYSATADTRFLEPYLRARNDRDHALAKLRASIEPLGVAGTDALVAREQRTNTEWLSNVAGPLQNMPNRTPLRHELHVRGKQYVDAFRRDDAALNRALSAAAAEADESMGRTVTGTLLFVIGALIAVSVGAAGFGLVQARTARSALENRLLYENEKRIADHLQEAFLTTALPASASLGLHATYIPAKLQAQVGGDWYDAFELPDGRILFSIGDVAGHGIEAAVVMSRARQSIVAAALHENDPAKVLERANDALCLQRSGMVTAICGYIDSRTLEITYATAGHPPPVLARHDRPAVFLRHDGIPLGVLPGTAYRTFVARAFDGAVMVLYTDGVIEDQRDVIKGEQLLLEAARAAALETDPALAIKARIFANGAPNDDVAIMTVTFKTSAGETTAAMVDGIMLKRLTVTAPDRSEGRLDTTIAPRRSDESIGRAIVSVPRS